MDDASLDEFLDAGDGESDSEESVSDGEESTSDDEVEPAVSTYQWTPDSSVCDACGERADRRWRDEPGLVCPECKEW